MRSENGLFFDGNYLNIESLAAPTIRQIPEIEIMKPQQFLRLAQIAIAAAACIGVSASVQAVEVEVLHYWTSGGEAKAAAELKKMMEAKGIGWKDFVVVGGGGENAMAALKARVSADTAPTAAQIKGPSIQEWGNQGVLANLDSAASEGRWYATIPKVFSKIMKYKGHYVAAPVNVHRVNWLWINAEVLNKAGAKAPVSFEEFFAVADKIKKAGFIPIAHGGQPWQDATVFESVALGVGGADFYGKALVELDQGALTSPTMLKVFNTLDRIKTYMDKDAPGRDWNLATAMVIDGKAGMQFMGDWAKGEFTKAGKRPGKDFLCVTAPGTADAYTFNIDSMTMFKTKTTEQRIAQLTLASEIMNPKFQEIFNITKGSIPAQSGIPRAKFDSCAIKSMDDMETTSNNHGLVPSFAHGMAINSVKASAMQDVIAKFMNTTMSSQEAVQALAKAAKTK